MTRLLLSWIILTISLLAAAYFIPGIAIKSFGVAVVAAVVMAAINLIIKPILFILTLPLTLLTLGLFAFVVNAIAFWLVASFTPGFTINSFWDALLGSIVVSVVSSVLNLLTGTNR